MNASTSYNSYKIHNEQSTQAMTQLATGKTISVNNLNSSSFVQAGKAASNVRSMAMGAQNLNQAIAMIQSIDATAALIENQLLDMVQKTMSVSSTLNTSYIADNGIICDYIQWAQENIQELATNHSFNGVNFMVGGGENDRTTTALVFNVNTTGGNTAGDTLQMTFKSFHPHSAEGLNLAFYGDPAAPGMPVLNASAGTDTHAYGDSAMYSTTNAREGGWHTDEMSAATESLIQMNRAIAGVAAERARLGAYTSRLQHMSERNLGSLQKARSYKSQIEDTDYAQKVVQLSKSQILMRVSTAMLTHANTDKHSLLDLLK
jgi:flagellin-like hook-associated protein FlgL